MDIVLPFTIVKNDKQYDEYCNIIYELMNMKNITEAQEDVMDLLTILVETFDRERYPDDEPFDPVEHLKFLMEQNRMKAADLAIELSVSKSLVSDILNYRRGFSKSFIRKLGKRFLLRQELWNRPYKLKPAKRKKISKSTKAATSSKAAKTSNSSKPSKVSKPSKTSKPSKALRSSGSSKPAKPIRRIKPSKSSKAKVA